MNEARQETRKKSQQPLALFLIPFGITLLLLAGTYLFWIYLEPQSILNPNPPLPENEPVSAQAVAVALTQTLAKEALVTPTSSATPSPTASPTQNPPTATSTTTRNLSPTTSPTIDTAIIEIKLVATNTHPDQMFYTPTPTPKTGYLYNFKLVNEPRYKPAPYNEFIPNPILNCNWIGVGGQVLDILGNPLKGIQVRLGGIIHGEEMEQRYTISGESAVYGPSGYEFKLGNETFYTAPTIYIQLIDKDGLPLSSKAHFGTTDHCTQNWIEINFIQVR